MLLVLDKEDIRSFKTCFSQIPIFLLFRFAIFGRIELTPQQNLLTIMDIALADFWIGMRH